jgi:uncharacterized protein
MTVKPEVNATHMPFCSERCQLIDLGRWLSEEISIPVDRDDDNQDEPTPGKPALPPGWHDA